ncbi:MAG: T9SS type A sorting domain-containing protein [bacterium]|nr:T9SS type A sorting domain-containing protein [bacterium]
MTGNGSWGWGNGELEFYRNENVDIADVPGEPGNKALRIVAKQEGGPGIVDQWGNPLSYTSGKVVSKSFVSVQYGMIEARVQVPNLNLGGWPAVWMLGTATSNWPNCGEVDLMEMGREGLPRPARHAQRRQRPGQLDGQPDDGRQRHLLLRGRHQPGQPLGRREPGLRPHRRTTAPTTTTRARSSPDSCCTGCTGTRTPCDSRSWTTASSTTCTPPRSPWTPSRTSSASPFYLLANLAIGGAFTDCYLLGDPGAGLPVTMPFPATMYVDYVRAYQWNGQGEVFLGPPTPRGGAFGLFTDTTPVNDTLVTEVSSHIYVWESTLVNGTIPPFEGANGLAWRTNGHGWFGAGIMSIQPVNLFNFGEGHLNFRIKIPANVTFKIGVIDTWGNQYYVSFPAGQTKYGLVRNGEWGQASIPVTDLRGTAIDLRMLSYEFVILEEQGVGCEFALDDIYYSGGLASGTDRPEYRPVGAKVLANVPNPFNAGTELRFELPAAGPYAIEVYDIGGRRVTGFQGIGQVGVNAVRWDGRDELGRNAAAGVYHYRLLSAGSTASGKLVLVK